MEGLQSNDLIRACSTQRPERTEASGVFFYYYHRQLGRAATPTGVFAFPRDFPTSDGKCMKGEPPASKQNVLYLELGAVNKYKSPVAEGDSGGTSPETVVYNLRIRRGCSVSYLPRSSSAVRIFPPAARLFRGPPSLGAWPGGSTYANVDAASHNRPVLFCIRREDWNYRRPRVEVIF